MNKPPADNDPRLKAIMDAMDAMTPMEVRIRNVTNRSASFLSDAKRGKTKGDKKERAWFKKAAKVAKTLQKTGTDALAQVNAMLAARRELLKDGKFTTFSRIAKTSLDAFREFAAAFAEFLSIAGEALSLPGVSNLKDLLNKDGFENVFPIRVEYKPFAADFKNVTRTFAVITALKTD